MSLITWVESLELPWWKKTNFSKLSSNLHTCVTVCAPFTPEPPRAPSTPVPLRAPSTLVQLRAPSKPVPWYAPSTPVPQCTPSMPVPRCPPFTNTKNSLVNISQYVGKVGNRNNQTQTNKTKQASRGHIAKGGVVWKSTLAGGRVSVVMAG